LIDLQKQTERAIAVAQISKGANKVEAKENLDELAFLAETAGAEVIEIFWQELEKPNNTTVLGKGKIEELKEFVDEEKINLVIFDDELSPMQLRNLEKAFDVKVMDRSGVILDIFADRAKSNEAKTQVELAQMQYFLPRLTRLWTHLSKQFGGIGSKGPGETQIETDRRLIRNKIEHLKKKLQIIDRQNEQKRANHRNIARFGLVGYTNAGKSTIMKLLTGSNVYVEDKLFATLDTTVRKFELPLGKEALLSDTVGFIRKLPAHLVASFRSTLAEAKESDYLLHVVDLSNPFFRDHIKIVEDTLESLDISSENVIIIFNKIDLLDDLDELSLIREQYPESIFISAHKGMNIDQLKNLLQNKYDLLSNDFLVEFPYSKSNLLSEVYKLGEIIERTDTDDGYKILIRVNQKEIGKFKNIFNDHLQLYQP
jgi:GTP-binding protein HflX